MTGAERPGPKGVPVDSPWMVFRGESIWLQVVNALFSGNLKWPELDEAAMKHLGEWVRYTSHMLGGAHGTVGQFINEIEKSWPSGQSPTATDQALRAFLSRLRNSSEEVNQLTSSILTKAGSVQYAKMSMIITAYITIVQIIVSLILAALSGPIGSLLTASTIFTGRTTIGMALGKLLTFLAQPVMVLLRSGSAVESGARLLPGVGRLMTARSAGATVVRSVAGEITEEVVFVDGGTKLWQLLNGDGDLVDWSQTIKALTGAVLGGALGVPVGAGIHHLFAPVTNLITAGLYWVMRNAGIPNLTLPPGVGGVTKWVADSLRMAPATATTNAVVSTGASEFNTLAYDHGFNVNKYADNFSWARLGESMVGAGLAGAGRSGTQEIAEISNAARSALDIAVNGSKGYEQRFLDAARNNPELSQFLNASNVDVNAFTWRQLEDFHGVYNPIDAVYSPEHYDARFPTQGHSSVPAPVNYTAATDTNAVDDPAVHHQPGRGASTYASSPSTAQGRHEGGADASANPSTPLPGDSNTDQSPAEHQNSPSQQDSGEIGSADRQGGDNLTTLGSTDGSHGAAFDDGDPTGDQPASEHVRELFATMSPEVARQVAIQADADFGAIHEHIVAADTAGLDRVRTLAQTVADLSTQAKHENRARVLACAERAEARAKNVARVVTSIKASGTPDSELRVLSELQRTEFNLLADLREVAGNTGANGQAALMLGQLSYAAAHSAADQLVRLRTESGQYRDLALRKANEPYVGGLTSEAETTARAREIQQAIRVIAHESLLASRHEPSRSTHTQAETIGKMVRLAGHNTGISEVARLFDERTRDQSDRPAEATEEDSSGDPTDTTHRPVDAANPIESRNSLERLLRIDDEIRVTRVEIRGIEAELATVQERLAETENQIAGLRGTLEVTPFSPADSDQARPNLIQLALESGTHGGQVVRGIGPLLWSRLAEARALRADLDALHADAEAHQRLVEHLNAERAAVVDERIANGLDGDVDTRPSTDASRSGGRRPAGDHRTGSRGRKDIPGPTRRRQRKYPSTYRQVTSAGRPRVLRAGLKTPRTWRSAWWLPGERAKLLRSRVRARRILTADDFNDLNEFQRLALFHQSALQRLFGMLEPLGIPTGWFADEITLPEDDGWIPAEARELQETLRRLEDKLQRLVSGSDQGRDRGFAIVDGIPRAQSRLKLVRDGLLTLNHDMFGSEAIERMAYSWKLIEHYRRPENSPRPVLAHLRQHLLSARWPEMRVKPTNEPPILRQHISWNGFEVPDLGTWTAPAFDDVVLVHPVERWKIFRWPVLRFLNPGFTLALVPREVLAASRTELAGIDIGIELPSGGILLQRPIDKTQYTAAVPEGVDPQVVIDEVNTELARLAKEWPQGMTSAWRHALRDTTPAFAGGLGTLVPFLFAGTSAIFVVLGRLVSSVIRGTIAATIPYVFARDSRQSAQLADRAKVQLRGVPQRKGAIAEAAHVRERSLEFLRRHGREVPPEPEYTPVRELTDEQWTELIDKIHAAVADGVPDGLQERLAEKFTQKLDMSFDAETGTLTIAIAGRSPQRLTVNFTRGWKSYTTTPFRRTTTLSREAGFDIKLSPGLVGKTDDEIMAEVLEELRSAVDQRMTQLIGLPRLTVLLIQEFMTTTPAAVVEFGVAYALFGPLKAIALVTAAVMSALAAGLQGMLDTFWDFTASLIATREIQDQQDRADNFTAIKKLAYQHNDLVGELHSSVDAITNRALLLDGRQVAGEPAVTITPEYLHTRAREIFHQAGAVVDDTIGPDDNGSITLSFGNDSSVGKDHRVTVVFHPYSDLRQDVMFARRVMAEETSDDPNEKKNQPDGAKFRVHLSENWSSHEAVNEELTRVWRTIVWAERSIGMRPVKEFLKKASSDVALTAANMPVLALEGNKLALSSESYRAVEGSLQGHAEAYGHRKMFALSERSMGSYFAIDDHVKDPTSAEVDENLRRLDRDTSRTVGSVIDQLADLAADPGRGSVESAKIIDELTAAWSLTHDQIVTGFAPLAEPGGPVMSIPGVLAVEPLADDTYRILVGRSGSYLKSIAGGDHPVMMTVRISSHRMAEGVSIWPTSRWGVDVEIGVSAKAAKDGYQRVLTELTDLVALWAVLPTGLADLKSFVDNSARVQLGALGNRVGSGWGGGGGILTSLTAQLPWVAGHTMVHAASSRWHTIGLRNVIDMNNLIWLRYGRWPGSEQLQFAGARYLEILSSLEKLDRGLDILAETTGGDGGLAQTVAAVRRRDDGTYDLAGSSSNRTPATGEVNESGSTGNSPLQPSPDTVVKIVTNGPWIRVGTRLVTGRVLGRSLRQAIIAGQLDVPGPRLFLSGVIGAETATEVARGLGFDVIFQDGQGSWARTTP